MSTSNSKPDPHASPKTTPWFFRYRGLLIFVMIIFLVFWPWWRFPLEIYSIISGLILTVLGFLLRLWCIRQIGGAARKTSAPKAEAIITWGPYGWIRNPIYMANMICFAGCTVLFGLLWALPVLLGIMALQYVATVRYEESFLRDKFGEEFERYSKETPRWFALPRWKSYPENHVPYPWPKLLKRERGFIFGLVFGVGLLLIFIRIILPWVCQSQG